MLNVGLIGLGGMGRTHARHYRNIDNCHLAAVYDIDQARCRSFAEEHGASAKASAEEVLGAADVIDICTPTPSHHGLIMLALRAGKPVVCEKPMCRTLEQCREVVAEVASRDAIFMPAHVVRYFPEFVRARRLIEDGAVGTPAAIRVRRGGPFPRWSSGWFGDFAQSGGVILDLIIHDFDWLRWTFGEVERVFAKGLLDRGVPQLDYALVTLRFRSGAIGHVEGSWADPAGFRVTFEVAGDDGFIEHDTRKVATFVASKQPEGDAPAPPSERACPDHPLDDPYRLELAHFIDCAEQGRKPDITAEDGLRAVEISLAATESLRTGEPVTIGGTR
jgi:UDP-N-acetylglucosamine 3-dehydrogenase